MADEVIHGTYMAVLLQLGLGGFSIIFISASNSSLPPNLAA
jgi:hypothetical protein